MQLSRREKQILVAACIVACCLGAYAGYAALSVEREYQFHGGVLDEDRTWVMWHNAWVTVRTFVGFAGGAFAALGLLPVGLGRLLSRMRR